MLLQIQHKATKDLSGCYQGARGKKLERGSQWPIGKVGKLSRHLRSISSFGVELTVINIDIFYLIHIFHNNCTNFFTIVVLLVLLGNSQIIRLHSAILL